MKLGFVLAVFFASIPSSFACPNLAGEYLCLIQDGHSEPKLDLFTLKQWDVKTEPGVTYFSSEYRSIPGGIDVYRADAVGIPDGWGWINRCAKDRLVSVRYDHLAQAELYLDVKGDLVFADNGVISRTCSRKKSNK